MISQFQNYSDDTSVSNPAFQSLSFIKWVLSSTQRPPTAPITCKSPCGESITILHQVCSSTERLWWSSAPAAIPGMWIRLLMTDTGPSCTSQRCRQRTWGRVNATFHMQEGKGVLWKWNFGTDVNECLHTHTHTYSMCICQCICLDVTVNNVAHTSSVATRAGKRVSV